MAQVHRTAAIIAIGDELVLGEKLDTNSRWLSDRLVGLAVRIGQHICVGDDERLIASAIQRVGSDVDLVVVTGGLGPTRDDRTRAALSLVLGEELIEDPVLVSQLRAWFGQREMPDSNLIQACRPGSSQAMSNGCGTAPGLFARVGDGFDVACLPGPPAEMRAMFNAELLGRLRIDLAARAIRNALVQTVGLGESDVGERLGALMERGRNPVVGTTASGGLVTCRVRFDGPIQDADAAIRSAVDEVHQRLGTAVFAIGDQTLAGECIRLLHDRDQTLCTVESCTGGMVAKMLTESAGSSNAYVGGWVTYTNQMKHTLLDVPIAIFEQFGAVSARCASAMARGGLQRSDADHAISITGIAGPSGGSADKPVGTVWIARASADGTSDTRRFVFPGDRAAVRGWSAVSALAMLRLMLVDQNMPLLFEAEQR